jgi:hypothetical protein
MEQCDGSVFLNQIKVLSMAVMAIRNEKNMILLAWFSSCKKIIILRSQLNQPEFWHVKTVPAGIAVVERCLMFLRE